jgi:nicotinamide-nucleotide amidase
MQVARTTSAAVLTVGTELTRGEILDRNAAWLASELAELGHELGQISCVADVEADIVAALRRLAAAHAFVVVTGGLGPTSDDRTAESAAKAAETTVELDESEWRGILAKVQARLKTPNEGHRKQAMLPKGCQPLINAAGTAPGFTLSIDGGSCFFLPGVPREMKRMFTEQVRPRLPSPQYTVAVRRLRTYGLGESSVAARIADLEGRDPSVQLGYRVHFPEVDVKVQCRKSDREEAEHCAGTLASEVRTRLGDRVYGEGDEDFATVVARAVRQRGWRIALAESCTGGLIARTLTAVPASDYFVGAAVTYANSAKVALLGVREDTLRHHGAVSAEVAVEMAEGVRRVLGVDVGLAVTGIAGPTGGSSAKPVGTVHWALSGPDGTVAFAAVFTGERDEIQLAAAYSVMDLLRRVASRLPIGQDETTPNSILAR